MKAASQFDRVIRRMEMMVDELGLLAADAQVLADESSDDYERSLSHIPCPRPDEHLVDESSLRLIESALALRSSIIELSDDVKFAIERANRQSLA